MQFRTEIGKIESGFELRHADRVLMLGSCFTDEIGERLIADGFDVITNPLGPIYNPVTLVRTLSRAIDKEAYSETELVDGPRGKHCLDYATRFSGLGREVTEALNEIFTGITEVLNSKPVVFLTLGSAFVYEYRGSIIGNCHKFPATEFERRLLSTAEIIEVLRPILSQLFESGCRIAVTVSPIRHIADGLHGNTLSKATLHLSIDALQKDFPELIYFPSFEILNDDLRDYRFYARDMKHPSEVAVDYIYEKFMDTFMNSETKRKALEARKEHKRSLHRPIL